MSSTGPTVVSSRDNPLVKELRRLSEDGTAYRKTGRFWIEGEHLCQAYLSAGFKPELAVFSESNWRLTGAETAWAAIKIVVVQDTVMRSFSTLESAAGMGFMCAAQPAQPLQVHANTVVLDRLQDPGNAGSILRSAAAFGFTQVLALKGTVALWSPKVLRAGMGAHFGLRIVEGAGLDEVQQLQSPLAVTSSHQGRYLHDLLQCRALPSPICWALGHEGQGVGETLAAMAALRVRIAQPGGQESLNVAAAAAVCLHASATAQLIE